MPLMLQLKNIIREGKWGEILNEKDLIFPLFYWKKFYHNNSHIAVTFNDSKFMP